MERSQVPFWRIADKRPGVIAWGPFPWNIERHLAVLERESKDGKELFDLRTTGYKICDLTEEVTRRCKIVLIGEDMDDPKIIQKLRTKIGNALLIIVTSCEPSGKLMIDKKFVDGVYVATGSDDIREYIHCLLEYVQSRAQSTQKLFALSGMVPPAGIEPTS